jgi:hypothetical protein
MEGTDSKGGLAETVKMESKEQVRTWLLIGAVVPAETLEKGIASRARQ